MATQAQIGSEKRARERPQRVKYEAIIDVRQQPRLDATRPQPAEKPERNRAGTARVLGRVVTDDQHPAARLVAISVLP